MRFDGFSVVIPVYDSTASVVELCQRLTRVFEETIQQPFEIILVDDASPNPETWKTLEELHEQDNRIKVIQLMRNFGQQPATLCGMKYAMGEYIITMDDDLQHLPEEIPKLISQKAHDVVVAQFKQRQHGLMRIVFSKVKQWFDWKILSKPKGLHLSSFRLIKREIARNILEIKTTYPFVGTMLFMVTTDIKGVETRHGQRTHGETGYTFLRMFKLFFDLLINNSTFLLNIVGVMGVIISAFSFFLAAFVFIKKIFLGVPIIGWASLMVMTSFIGGIILFSVSIIGQYLIRIIHEVQGRPNYATRNVKM